MYSSLLRAVEEKEEYELARYIVTLLALFRATTLKVKAY